MKKIIPVVAAVFAMGMVLTGPAYAAPKEPVKSEEIQKVKQNPQQNKGQLQQLASINKKLDKIEEKINHYQQRLSNLDQSDLEEQDGTGTQEENGLEEEQIDTNDEALTNDPTNENASETEAGGLENNEVNTAAKDVKKVPFNTTISNTDPDNIVDSEDDAAEVDGDQSDDENSEGVLDDEENDKALEDEVDQYPGYAGKFHALQNRLNAVTFQVNKLESKGTDSEQIQLCLERINTLQDRITEALTMLNQVQEQVTEELSEDESLQAMAPAEDVPVTKEWTINFSQKLDPESLSNLDVIVLDKEQKLVETSISYSDETKSVKILPNQPYRAGETYTLYVGKKISGKSGKDLKTAVKMDFTVK